MLRFYCDYQMLGRRIDDPHGIEGPAGRSVEGLGLLDVTTTLTRLKRLAAVTGVSVRDRTPLSGYEMHVGETTGPGAERPFALLDGERPDGAVSPDGLVAGTYLHGLFADDRQRARWLSALGAPVSELGYETLVEGILERLADHLEAHLDWERLYEISAQRST